MKRSFKNSLVFLVVLCTSVALQSCYISPVMSYLTEGMSPYTFILNKNTDLPIGGYILSNLDSVDVISDNSLKLSGGKVILGAYYLTQFAAEFHTKITRGEGVRFILRSNGDSVNHLSALRFEYTVNGCRVLQGDSVLLKTTTLRANLNSLEKIRITNYGDLCRIEVGCDRIFERRISTPSTESVTIEALPDSEIILTNIDLERTRPARYTVSLPDSE
ncbi:MAG: hypothetical protein V4642_12715 [Bacteroidota bacterium]